MQVQHPTFPLQIAELPGGQPAPRTVSPQLAAPWPPRHPSIHDPEVMARSDDENPKAEVLKKPATPLSALALFNASGFPKHTHLPVCVCAVLGTPARCQRELALIGV